MSIPSTSLLSIAQTLLDDQHTQQACQLLEEIIHIEPENRSAHILFAHALCRLGCYDLGSKEFTWIWKHVFGNQIGLLSPSEDLVGKRILISSDAGLGDSIMFARLVTKLSKYQTKVILQVQAPLVRLFKQSNLCQDVIASDQMLPEYDIRVPMHNLMAAMDLGKEWPLKEAPAYLKGNLEDSEKFRKLFPKDGKRKVGICWQGNPSLPVDSKRSISLEQIQKFTLPDDQLISLVPGHVCSNSMPMLTFIPQDIADTAALIQCLDLVITVDTMVCHLSGALGVPTILLNRYGGCWRWGDEGLNSIWYDSVKILRQSRVSTWKFDPPPTCRS